MRVLCSACHIRSEAARRVQRHATTKLTNTMRVALCSAGRLERRHARHSSILVTAKHKHMVLDRCERLMRWRVLFSGALGALVAPHWLLAAVCSRRAMHWHGGAPAQSLLALRRVLETPLNVVSECGERMWAINLQGKGM